MVTVPATCDACGSPLVVVDDLPEHHDEHTFRLLEASLVGTAVTQYLSLTFQREEGPPVQVGCLLHKNASIECITKQVAQAVTSLKLVAAGGERRRARRG